MSACKKAVFYANDTLDNIRNMEYYSEEIRAITDAGYEVIVCNKYREIPYNFDLILIYWWTYSLPILLFCLFFRRKAFVSGAFNFKFQEWQSGNDYFRRPIWQKILLNLSLLLSNKNLFISKNDFLQCKSYFKLSNAHFHPPCVSTDYFENHANSSREKKALTMSWLSQGNLHRKGIFDSINAIRLLKDDGFEARLHIIGMIGDAYDELLHHIKKLGLEENIKVEVNVPRDRKIELMRSYNLYIQPSYYEGFGLSAAEALASGMNVIASRVGDVFNTLGENAYYVEPGNIKEIADAYKELIGCVKSPEAIRVSREYLLDNFSYENKKNFYKNCLLNKE